MADSEHPPLSDWLELMLDEIARRQDEVQAADAEQAARSAQPAPSKPQSKPARVAVAHPRDPAKRTTNA